MMSTKAKTSSSLQLLSQQHAYLLFRLIAIISVPLSLFFVILNVWQHRVPQSVNNGVFFIFSSLATYLFRKKQPHLNWQRTAHLFLIGSSILHAYAGYAFNNGSEYFIIRNLLICLFIGGSYRYLHLGLHAGLLVVVRISNILVYHFSAEDFVRRPLNVLIWVGCFVIVLIKYRKELLQSFYTTESSMDALNIDIDKANKKIKAKQGELKDAVHETMLLSHKIKQSKKNLNNLLQHLESDNSPKVKALKQNLTQSLTNSDNNHSLLTAFNRVDDEFIHHLNQQHPNLTAYEVNLLLLHLLKLNTEQICSQMIITEGSLRKAKTRLRKKLQLPERTNLYEYVREF